jgi:hypothetical protein
MSNRHILILTNCTNRKRGPIPQQLLARSLPKATYEAVSAEWVRRLDAASQHYVADRLYCGRAVTETLQAAGALSAEVVFLSAGLGVVPQAGRVPAYNLTSTPGLPDSINGRLNEPYSAAQWWKELGIARGNPNALARIIRDREPVLVLAALPASYLGMVGKDLENLPPLLRRTLRIIGPRRTEEVPEGLRAHWLPYDWRLDSPETGFNGTTADFPHRALRHFVTEISDNVMGLSARQHQTLVENALSRFTPYAQRRGAKASDAEVLVVIRRLWHKCDGNRTRVLRELRAHSGLACEQGRFRRLADRFEGKL